MKESNWFKVLQRENNERMLCRLVCGCYFTGMSTSDTIGNYTDATFDQRALIHGIREN